MSLSEETRWYTLGRAKEQMFGKGPSKWPEMEQLIESGEILTVEKAYAEMHTDSENRAIAIVQLLAQMRAGFLTDLPKHKHLIDSIVTHVKRLNGPMPAAVPTLPDALNIEQRQAVETALAHRLSIITGGPGTGKTFTATALISAHDGTTLIGAPTGKAASHLIDKVGGEGGTLHTLLNIKSLLDTLRAPQPLQAELIVIDESSMIDPTLFAHLLSAISDTTRIVFMGDVNQLPAVEGGSIFADLIASRAVPVTELKTCMRSDRREILDLAAAVLAGTTEDIRTCDLGFASGSIEIIYKRLIQYASKKDFSNFRILSTLRRGPLGVTALNHLLHEELNVPQVPILITRNDPKRGFANGDTAMIEGEVAYFPDGREAPLVQLPPYELAYCLSVHKAQGSEYDDILFLVPDGSESFGREVLYTAITRARNTLDIDGNPEEIAGALSYSALKPSKIRDYLQR